MGKSAMRWRKRAGVLAAAAAMTFSMALCTWGAGAKEAYTYTSGTVQFGIGDGWDRVYQALGREMKSAVVANCANGGTDKYYEYADCDIYVSQDAKKQVVIDMIVLRGDAVTEEGLKLGMAPKDVKRIYPAALSEQGLYTVEQGGTRIVIDCGVNDDKVVDISYETAD